MSLVPLDPSAPAAYRVEVETAPPSVIPGRQARLRVTVRDRNEGHVVRDFAVVHEKRYHLFVISQDLEHYDHVHPSQDEDGSWVAEVMLPREGQYKVYSDFMPSGGAPQVIAVPLVVGNHATDGPSRIAALVPDRVLRKAVGNMSVTLDLPDGGLVAGRNETLVYHMTDASTGASVTDIEPYLGAWGHTVVMSEDTHQFVHAHPVETMAADDGAAGGGPTLTFRAIFPTPGRYRVWTQMKRGGELSTAVFTIAIAAAAK